MAPSRRASVQERAGYRCEYCQLHQEDSPLAVLHVEHIIPRIHGGTDDLDNLALACIDCNLHKGPNLTGVDPETKRVTELFHPRLQRWEDHFELRDTWVVGRTPVGRATVPVLAMNSDEQLELRAELK